MDKILVTYGTRPFAQRLGKLLSTRYTCHYASSEAFPEVLLKGNYRKIPAGPNPVFAHELLKLALDEGYRWILPLGRLELQPLQETRILFEEYGITILLPESLEYHMLIENPPADLDIKILDKGLDILSDMRVLPEAVTGAVVLSDAGEEPALCLV